MEEIYEEKNKKTEKNKSLIIIIVILSVLLLGTISFIVYDKVLSKEEVQEEKVKEEKSKTIEKEDVIVSITEQDAQNMLKQIEEYNKYLSTEYPINDINQVNHDDLTQLVLMNREITSDDTTFMESDLDKAKDKYFGNEYKYEHKDIPCSIDNETIYKYDSAKRNYSFYGEHGHGGPTINTGYAYFIDGTHNQTQNTYTINTKVIYRNPLSDTFGPATNYYSSAQDALESKNQIYKVSDEEIMTLQPETVYNKVKDQLKITSYEFKVDSEGNYGLIKVTIK